MAQAGIARAATWALLLRHELSLPSKKMPSEPNRVAALRSAIAYLRDEAMRLHLYHIARALGRVLVALDKSRPTTSRPRDQ
jgi:hypothetical protein